MASDREFQTGRIQNTLVAYWAGEPTAVRLTTLVHEMRELHATNPDGVYLYNVISPRTGMPDRAARELIAKQFDSMRAKLLAAAIVLEHSGIQYTISRTVIATLTTISRNPFALRVFDRRMAAAQWLSAASKVPSQSLLTLVDSLEAGRSNDRTTPESRLGTP